MKCSIKIEMMIFRYHNILEIIKKKQKRNRKEKGKEKGKEKVTHEEKKNKW